MIVNFGNDFFFAIATAVDVVVAGGGGGHSNQNDKHEIHGQAKCQHKSSSRLHSSQYYRCVLPKTEKKSNSDTKPIIRLTLDLRKIRGRAHFICVHHTAHCIRYREFVQ